MLAECPQLRRSYLVGGCVRDWLLDETSSDYDIEVFGLDYRHLVEVLSPFGRTNLVGRSFGVVKLTLASGATYDFSIPRRDSKVARGHKGFISHFDPAIREEEAASRRDFTINALMYDPRAQRVLDFFGGMEDLRKRVLRHTSDAFREDPLRVLRGMQLCARLDLQPTAETVEVCRQIKAGYAELAIERVWAEWYKWATRSTRPSAGLRFLDATGWLAHFPEIAALKGTPQDPEWHPEGDVFVHTGHCCDAMSDLPAWQQADADSRAVYMLAILAHDFAKPQTTETSEKNGRLRIVSPGHEQAGGEIAERFLERIQAPRSIRERVVPLVSHHLAHLQTPTDRAVRRLAKRLVPENIRGLCLVMLADAWGRPPMANTVPKTIEALQARAAALELQNQAPAAVLMGRHLLGLGLAPGPQLGRLLKEAYEAQLEGDFATLPDAYRWLAGRPDLDFPQHVWEALNEMLEEQ